MLMILNVLDLGVCVLTVIVQIFRVSRLVTKRRTHATIEDVTESIYTIFTENTGFAMLLLSVTRCISVSLPMYRIRGLYVAISAGMFIVYTATREITLILVDRFAGESYNPKVHVTFMVGGVGLLIVLVSVANIISVINLLKSDNLAEQSREAGFQATVTIVILSALFCVLNTMYCAAVAFHTFLNININRNFAIWFGVFYAVPINSTLNPMIYFWRKTEMNTYLRNLICRRRNSRINPQVPLRPQ